MNKHNRASGFTIVELLTVVVVIAILVTVVVVSWSTVQAKARDADRENTVTLLTSVFEQYYEKNGEYPLADDLNVTKERVRLPNYNAVRAVLPALKDINLTPSGYDFMPNAYCPTDSCSAVAGEREARKTQIYYMSSRANSYYYTSWPSSNDMWGCKIYIDYGNKNPGYAIAWREESTGKWLFERSRHGTVTIENYGGGPTAPTTCTFR